MQLQRLGHDGHDQGRVSSHFAMSFPCKRSSCTMVLSHVFVDVVDVTRLANRLQIAYSCTRSQLACSLTANGISPCLSSCRACQRRTHQHAGLVGTQDAFDCSIHKPVSVQTGDSSLSFRFLVAWPSRRNRSFRGHSLARMCMIAIFFFFSQVSSSEKDLSWVWVD